MKKNITFLVNSCDAYEDLWRPFFTALEKYWPCFSYPVILNTESKNFIFKKLNIKSNGTLDQRWGSRLLKNLTNINTEYVIMFFDDYIINKNINIEKINSCIDILEENKNVAVFYLVDINKHKGVYLSNKIKKSLNEIVFKNKKLDYQVISTKQNYRLNSAPAIWRVADLIQLTASSDSPWVWEFFGSARTYRTNKIFLCVGSDQADIVSYVNDRGMGGAIHRGEWLLPAIEFIEKDLGIQIRNKTERNIKISADSQPHSLIWKVTFLIDGFKAVGFDIFIFIHRSISKKFFNFFKY